MAALKLVSQMVRLRETPFHGVPLRGRIEATSRDFPFHSAWATGAPFHGVPLRGRIEAPVVDPARLATGDQLSTEFPSVAALKRPEVADG